MWWVQLLPPHTLLVVCLLACWLGREAVSHVDLIRGALLGQVPLLDMPARCRHLLDTAHGSALPVSMMKSATAYGKPALPAYLHAVTHSLHSLQLTHPPTHPCTHSLTQSLSPLLTHSLSLSFTHPPTHSPTQSVRVWSLSSHARVNGLLVGVLHCLSNMTSSVHIIAVVSGCSASNSITSPYMLL